MVLLGWPVLGIRPTWSALATAMLGVLGVAALVLGPAGSLDAIGVAAALGSAASMASGTVLARRFGRPPLTLVALTAWQLAFGGLLVAPFSLALEGIPPMPTTRNLAGFALMGIFGTAAAYALWIRGVTALPASSMQFLALLSPAVATVIGWVSLGQSLSPRPVRWCGARHRRRDRGPAPGRAAGPAAARRAGRRGRRATPRVCMRLTGP